MNNKQIWGTDTRTVSEKVPALRDAITLPGVHLNARNPSPKIMLIITGNRMIRYP